MQGQERLMCMLKWQRQQYPTEWDSLATACKERAGWRCEHCGIAQYAQAISAKGTPYLIYLHAAHKHHDKGNPHPELIALCIACHARYDYTHKQREARVKLEVLKHLRLLIAQGQVEVRWSV